MLAIDDGGVNGSDCNDSRFRGIEGGTGGGGDVRVVCAGGNRSD